uniref:Retrotransposon gag domain-containing protein n=1 Tax=Tanacetum cinerariifolium TaxID=118510 RepID=A0A6L2NIA9_TANCI|nr:hypothetical protein [Tanacetum cinerariifolium]
MRTRNSYFLNNSSVTILRRQNKRRTPNIVEPELRTIIEMADNHTMEELLQAPMEGYGKAIVILEINADHFEIKTNLLQLKGVCSGNSPELRTIVEIPPMADNHTMKELLQATTKGYGEVVVIPEINVDHFEIKTNLLQLVQENPYHSFERENPHTHINNFKRITSTLKFRDVPNDKTTHLKNEISRFTQRFEETFREAWEGFKEMLRACPHHEFTELAHIDTFYNGLNDNDQDFLNAASSGNLLSKTTREAL